MAKDYVKRSRPKPSKKTKKSPKTARKIPVLTIIVLVIVLAGFVGFLWYLKQEPAPQASQPTPPKVIPERKTKKEAELAPPKEQWRYVDELAGKEVKVDLPDAQEIKDYLLQCGSFRMISRAEEQKAKIAFLGIPSEVRRSDGKNGVWYRVVLGPYTGKRTAQSTKNKIKRGGIPGCKIWLWQN